jgi:catechol 2,3-dioxygenase-like lactoylglutathione lyase family enzyme
MSEWYSRPVFFVSDLKKASDFYRDVMGFKEAWSHEDKGKKIVAQMTRGSCEIILNENSERAGKSRVFIALEVEELEVLQKEIVEKKIETKNLFWGYPVIEIKDPDGNELLFPIEDLK